MGRVKDDKNIIDEIVDPGDSPLGWWLAICVVVVIGLVVLFAN
jgi:hypothetical protein